MSHNGLPTPDQPPQVNVGGMPQVDAVAQQSQLQPSHHREDDIHVAEAMAYEIVNAEAKAYAGDALRTKGAEVRKADEMFDAKEAKFDVLASINKQAVPSRFRPFARSDYFTRRQVAADAYVALNDPWLQYSQPLHRRHYEEYLQELPEQEADAFAWGGTPRDFHKGWEDYDKRADRVEEIAGVLHDHPVSQDFQDANPEVDITPKGLLIRAEAAERTQARAAFYRERVQRMQWDDPEEDDDGGSTGYGALEGLIYSIGGRADVDYATAKENELHFMRRMKASQDDLNEFYRTLYTEANVKPLEDEVAQTQGIFDALQDDIHAGLPGLNVRTASAVK